MVNPKRDCLNAVGILAFCIFAYIEALSIPDNTFGKTGGAFFPKIIIASVAGLAIVYLLQSVYRMRSGRHAALNFSIVRFCRENSRVIAIFILFGGYTYAFSTIGYITSTILFLISIFALLKGTWQNLWVGVVGSVVFTVALYFIFQDILSVILPAGILI